MDHVGSWFCVEDYLYVQPQIRGGRDSVTRFAICLNARNLAAAGRAKKGKIKMRLKWRFRDNKTTN